MLPLLAAGSLLLNVGGSIFNYKAQQKQVKAQERAAAQLKADTISAVFAAAGLDNAQLDLRGTQEKTAAEQAIDALVARQNEESLAARRSVLQVDREARMASSVAALSAGASGVAGASVSALLNDVGVQAAQSRTGIADNLSLIQQQIARQTGVIRQNLDLAQQDIGLQHQVVEANRKSRVNGVENLQTQPRPNPFMLGLEILGHGLDFGTQLQTRKP